MAVMRYVPDLNDKRSLVKGEDPAGWYEIVTAESNQLKTQCRWWNGFELNHSPNMRRGYSTDSIENIRSISRLVPAN